jgi:Skp family chaperone for outer membrane proteins
MAGQDWKKNKKGFMVNPEGKTARQVRTEKRSDAKASGGGGGGGGGGGDNFDNYSEKQLQGMLAELEPVMKKLDKATKGPAPKTRAKSQSAKPKTEDNFDNYSKEQLKGMLAESESVMKKLDKLTKGPAPKTKRKSSSNKP